jgi:hypothetical protein
LSQTARKHFSKICSLHVVSIPYTLINTSVVDARFHSIHLSERIRARDTLGPDGKPTPERLALALKVAHNRMSKEMSSKDCMESLAGHMVDDLARLLKSPDLGRASHELLLETIVMIWGAFEVFVTDTLRTMFNAHPNDALKLLSDEAGRKYFPTRGVPIEALAEHQFNLTGAMGDLLLADRRLDSISVVKDVLSVVFGEHSSLREQLAKRELWVLSQRRHLIAHRRGEVDAAYCKNTGEQLPLGQRLQINSKYVYSSFELVRDVAIAVLDAARRKSGQAAKAQPS